MRRGSLEMRSVCLVVGRPTLSVQAAFRVLAFLASPRQPALRHLSTRTSLHGGMDLPPSTGGRDFTGIYGTHAP